MTRGQLSRRDDEGTTGKGISGRLQDVPSLGRWPYMTTKVNMMLFLYLGLCVQALSFPSTPMATRANKYTLLGSSNRVLAFSSRISTNF